MMCEGCGASIPAAFAALIVARVVYRKTLPDVVIAVVVGAAFALVHWVMGRWPF
jgi:hypothetical protein